ncbi:MAG: hypothetical protein WCD51_07020 [Anaerolineae bacterium]
MDDSIDALPAKEPTTALPMEATPTAIGPLSGTHQPLTQLLYDSGLRLLEHSRLRVHEPGFYPGPDHRRRWPGLVVGC